MPVTHSDARDAVLIPQLPSRLNHHTVVWQAFNSRLRGGKWFRHFLIWSWLFWVSNSASKT
ncbi:uncharacterized protein LACBIDRAFT_304161 [Laccaria bicolor S238N-H82]|uniref:Predicted protein n=1 Tax=Laccaria bicolor (strain S238N-H82 / ATCC MYA-4686) TaxID=486041 RepID=B0DL33_LACBS|nr:uncharacterized protein LACBIDRAFT_304161 [Laccaria bicolor S238N-H82]EDR04841.1 predicted protein [Laccaria bicolor S238N-H82]|eukprot:XP_001884665.1 predicted protein [Laccaria bicolor S238N-H82]